MAFFLFASVYLKPAAWPVCRPNKLFATSRPTSARRRNGNGLYVRDALMKVRSNFVTFARADRMALSTARLEKLSTSLRVTL
jgi:hypothetical protein